MKVLGIVGPADDRRSVASDLVERLSVTRSVGVVTGPTQSDGAPVAGPFLQAGAAVTQEETEGMWRTTRPSRSLDAVLDELAAECDVALVLDRPEATIPQVVIGEASVAGDVLHSAPNADTVDLEGIEARLPSVEPRETLQSLIASVKDSSDEIYAGAIATFTGRVRAKDDPEDEYTEQLTFERYDDVVESRMREIRESLEARDGVYEVRLHHRTGVLEAGEDIVFVVVLAGHRGEAFATVEDGIDRLKEVVPLFKKEVTVEDEFWAHEQE